MESEYREKGSRFLSRAGYAASAEEALAEREADRRRHRDATHHVFAFRPERPDESRYDDDGEPAGTAGRPTLSAIEAAGLSLTAVLTTRFYGGTKLGTGGLARAYAVAARTALENLEVVGAVRGVRASLSFPYSDTGAVMRAVEAAGAQKVGEQYTEGVRLEVEVPGRDRERLTRLLLDSTAGRAQVRFLADLVLIRLRS